MAKVRAKAEAGVAVTAAMTGQRRQAVVQCADAAYFPYALHLMWQIDRLTPHRKFDLVIASASDLVVPDALAPLGIIVQKLPDAIPDDFAKPHQPKSMYTRIHMPDALADRYDRLLYLDSDIVFEGGDIARFLNVDIGAYPIAAARTARAILWPNVAAKEFQIAGLGNLPYFSTGVMLIDTARYASEACARRFMDAAENHPDARVLADQSLINLALQGKFAEFSPVWNWCIAGEFAILGQDLPVRFRHFNFKSKPWNDPKGVHPPAYHDSYRRFFQAYLPEALDSLVAPPRPVVLDMMRMVRRLVNFVKHRKQMTAFHSRFRDEWDIKL